MPAPKQKKSIESRSVQIVTNFTELSDLYDFDDCEDFPDLTEQLDKYELEKLIFFLEPEQKLVLLLKHFGYSAKESMAILKLNMNDYYSIFRSAKTTIKTFHLFYS